MGNLREVVSKFMTITRSVLLGMRRTIWYRHKSFACCAKVPPPPCTIKKKPHAHTLSLSLSLSVSIIIFHTYCFSTVTMVMQTSINVGLYIHSHIPRLVICYFMEMCGVSEFPVPDLYGLQMIVA